MSTSTVSRKGWIVIPKEIRDRYGLAPGDKVQVVDYGGAIAVVPSWKDPVRGARGLLKGGPSLSQALRDERRRQREREERGFVASVESS